MSTILARMKRPLSGLKHLVRHAMVALAYRLHGVGILSLVAARRLVRLTERHTIDTSSDRFVMELPGLQRRIRQELLRQRREYDSYAYFHGYPYQALAILDVFGERGTEERFDAYDLARLIGRDDYVLDIGCNCGFMALYAAFRTGCRADGIDINPHMIRIGQHCTEFLRLQDRVHLMAQPFQDFAPGQPYTVVLSFATHWTDDRNYRVRLQDHLLRIHGMMVDGGLLVFESHSTDVGNPQFYAALEEMRAHFTWEGPRPMARSTRELYLMRRIAA
ncbi:cyclopropane-fatty-acyl-phospholipid synthase family protein [Accumulibacter sp.]|uniref:SAM-dependent methyltransferase n=1 Tax=Accumulibacter sp. TaxID=2053492 RepID=UPI0025FB270D|nr:class I SAM-dependent methyltransferase [Accumulibacter sp.]MCM8594225.1 class I SAM-dependent methyltransferase [Accumulibacter sp.]MCM8625791.1 class I SAM-dependent methyltransferase [Accumulibacter sp.]MDS4048368.1 class I SAM-dependent methyltransferase [Accumulibacter sp.]